MGITTPGFTRVLRSVNGHLAADYVSEEKQRRDWRKNECFQTHVRNFQSDPRTVIGLKTNRYT
eukprot:369769-Amphidinium_carterae.1